MRAWHEFDSFMSRGNANNRDSRFSDGPLPIARKRILVVEPNHSGHRLFYVRLIVQQALEGGCHVIVATRPEAKLSAEWELHLQRVASQVDFIEFAESSSKAVSKLAEEVSADHVVVPDGDALIADIGRRRKWQAHASVSALLMREQGQPSRMPGVTRFKTTIKRLLMFSAAHVRGVRVHVLKSSLWSGTMTAREVRDPVVLADQIDAIHRAAKSWELDPERYWFGVVGAVTPRKNVHAIAAALQMPMSKPVGLVIAGSCDPVVSGQLGNLADELRRSGVAVRVENRLLSDVELDSVIAAVDCVVLAHSNEGSSGIMGKAAVLGTRVAAAGARSLEADCRVLPDLASWAPLSEPEFPSLLASCVGRSRPFPFTHLSSPVFGESLL